MLLSQQPQGCMSSMVAPRTQPVSQYRPTKLFNSLLSPAVTVCIEVTFTSDLNMAYWTTDVFDMGYTPPQDQRVAKLTPQNQSRAFEPPQISRANEESQAVVTYSERCAHDELNSNSNPRTTSSREQSIRQKSSDYIDVFEVQSSSNLTPSNAHQLDNANLARKPESPCLASTNTTPSNSQSPPHNLPSHSTETQAVNIETKRIHSPVSSSQRDPRTLFGSRGTHLPWVTKLSPNRFAMTVSPDTLSRDAPPPKSIWDADDDEFDRWPSAVEAREELDTMRQNATAKRSTFVRPQEPERSVLEQIAEAVTTPMGDATRSSVEQEQAILELEDMDCGNPTGRDLHDDVILPFRSREYPVLPHRAPVRHMHVLDANAYTTSTDPVVKAARPRLCDAVATVLAYTSPECLAAFLDPEVEVFEWRRLINCVMIRREGREVTVGNYYNFGTTYRWGYLVRSTIDSEGAWTETWGSVSQGTTPVGKDGVLFKQFDADGNDWDVEPDDEEFALYVGRQLADFFFGYEVWNYYKWWRYRVEWEADGKVTDAREENRYPAGLTFD